MAAPPPDADVDIEAQPVAPDVRRAADVLRLIVALAVVAAVLLVAGLAHLRVRRAELSLLGSVTALPERLRDACTAAVQLVAVALPLMVVVAAAAQRRFALIGRLVVTFGAAIAAGVLVSHLVLRRSHPATWPGLLGDRGGMFVVTFPPAAWLSATASLLTVAGSELSRRWRVGLWWVAVVAAAAEVLVGGILVVDAVAAVASGVAVGSLVLLTLGAPISTPSAPEVAAALQECGIELTALTELPRPPGGPATFRAGTRGGASLMVRVFAEEDRDRDRLTRLSRWVLRRDPDDGRGQVTVESAAEHELLAMVSAARAGARIPEPVIAYPVATRGGRRGALVAFMDVGGRRLDLLPADNVGDATLADLWHSVALLRQHRLAHGLLRPDHVLVDGCDQAWLIGLVQADLGASDRQLDTDVAELLASLGVQVGTDRSVASAINGLGRPQVAKAAAYLQPLALSPSTQAEISAHNRAQLSVRSTGAARRRLQPGGRPDFLADLRTAVAQQTETPPAELEHLFRFTWKSLLALLGAFAVIHLVLPQLANAGAALHALRTADWWWVLAALPALFVAQAFSTLLQQGTIPGQLPFGPTYVVQLGGSFLNRVTPNNVGGMALNFRYLKQTGVDSGAATGSVGLQALAGMVTNLLLVALFFALTGRTTTLHVSVHGRQRLLLLITVVLALGALVLLTPWGRRRAHDKVWGFLRSAGTTTADVARSPEHVALVVVGALGGPMVQITAFAMCVHAVGGHLAFAQVGAVYLGGHLLASAAPVPGGLGALEAALVAGLSGLGMAAGAAASAVLIYRLLTFWLTIPVGWVALRLAERRGYV
jgi:uncharacterized protein (TIRG00374 family)